MTRKRTATKDNPKPQPEAKHRSPELKALQERKTQAMSAKAPDTNDYQAICQWAEAELGISKYDADGIWNDQGFKFTRAGIINWVFALRDFAGKEVHEPTTEEIEPEAPCDHIFRLCGGECLNDCGAIDDGPMLEDLPADPSSCPDKAPEICPEADSHCSQFACFYCGVQLEPQRIETEAGHIVNDDGEVEDLPAIFQVLGWTEYPGLPAMPTAEEIAALRDKVDQVVDIVATCRERARRYREQGERRAKAKEARAKRYEQFIAAAAKVLGEHLIPRVQTGERQGAYRQKFLDLPSGRITYKKGGGWQFRNDVLQREVDGLPMPVIAAAGLPVREERRIDWQKFRALIKRTGNKIPIQSIEATGIAPLAFEGCEEAFEDPLAEICISAGNPGNDDNAGGEDDDQTT